MHSSCSQPSTSNHRSRDRSPGSKATTTLLGVLALCCLTPAVPHIAASFAAIHFVPQDFPSIQQAIDASVPGDTTVINTEALLVTSTIQVNKPNLTITGLGREPLPLVYWSSISGNEIFKISASGCTVEGLHLAAGAAQPAAFFISAGTTGTAVIGNHVEGLGVNLIRNWGDNFLLRDNFFDGCIDGVRLVAGSALVDNNVFEFGGRGIVVSSPAIISNNQILRCGWCDFGCNVQGVGIYARNITDGLTISGNLIEENLSSGSQGDDWDAWGGGILLENCQNVTIDSNILRANQAKLGAGLFAINSTLEATNNVFVDNYDDSNWPDNPDVGYGSIAYLSNCSATVTSNTFAKNSSSAGSAFFVQATILEFSNNILSHTISPNAALRCVGGSTTFNCNDFWENEGGISQGNCIVPIGDDGNLEVDPLYCNLVEGDFSLKGLSPCAPEHSPLGCGQIGALPVGCEVGSTPQITEQLRPMFVYPNPSRALPVLHLANEVAGPLAVRVFDASGRAVTKSALTDGTAGFVQLADLFFGIELKPGAYFVRVTSGSKLVRSANFTIVR